MESNINGKAFCKTCKNNVTPRLFNDEAGILNSRTIEHICPICGETMYTTGGDRTFIGTGLLLALIGYILFAISMITIGYLGFKEETAILISTTLVSLFVINYLLKKVFGIGLVILIKKLKAKI